MPRPYTATGAPSLSDVMLKDLRVDSTISALLDMAVGSGIAIGEKRSPVLHVVLEGAIQIRRAADSAPLRLSAGDSVLAFYGDAHRLGTDRDAFATDPLTGAAESTQEASRLIRVGTGPRTALLFSSALILDYISPTAFAYRAAPDLWVLRASSTPEDPAGRSIVIDPGQVLSACGGQGGAAFATAFANLHYVHMMRLMSQGSLQDRPLDVRAPNTRRMAQVVRDIKAHPDQKWTVARLAARVGLSRSAFAEAFVAYEHVAPLTFVTRVRMERAAQLLKTEVLSLHEVSRRIGYENEASFARAFKRHWGVPPRNFARKTYPAG